MKSKKIKFSKSQGQCDTCNKKYEISYISNECAECSLNDMGLYRIESKKPKIISVEYLKNLAYFMLLFGIPSFLIGTFVGFKEQMIFTLAVLYGTVLFNVVKWCEDKF